MSPLSDTFSLLSQLQVIDHKRDIIESKQGGLPKEIDNANNELSLLAHEIAKKKRSH